jgi:hypothetical protein
MVVLGCLLGAVTLAGCGAAETDAGSQAALPAPSTSLAPSPALPSPSSDPSAPTVEGVVGGTYSLNGINVSILSMARDTADLEQGPRVSVTTRFENPTGASATIPAMFFVCDGDTTTGVSMVQIGNHFPDSPVVPGIDLLPAATERTGVVLPDVAPTDSPQSNCGVLKLRVTATEPQVNESLTGFLPLAKPIDFLVPEEILY